MGEKRIYDLKKKNQELEKFKFVLDYKIKELKRDIGPREREIQKMKESTNAMDSELKHFNRVNANLGLIVDDLRMKQEEMQNKITGQRTRLREQEIYIRRFKDDVYESVQHIQDFRRLKEAMLKLFRKYVHEESRAVELDASIQKEYKNQKKYLEKSVDALNRKLKTDNELHKQENRRIMNENILLIEEINQLRSEKNEIKITKRQQNMSGTDPKAF